MEITILIALAVVVLAACSDLLFTRLVYRGQVTAHVTEISRCENKAVLALNIPGIGTRHVRVALSTWREINQRIWAAVGSPFDEQLFETVLESSNGSRGTAHWPRKLIEQRLNVVLRENPWYGVWMQEVSPAIDAEQAMAEQAMADPAVGSNQLANAAV